MSLIIHVITSRGLLAASDINAVRPGEHGKPCSTVHKTVLFPNSIVVSYCGNACITDNETLFDWVDNLSKELFVDEYGIKLSVCVMPRFCSWLLDEFYKKVLNYYVPDKFFPNVKFLITGPESVGYDTYEVSTCDGQIKCLEQYRNLSDEKIHYACRGVSFTADAMLSHIDLYDTHCSLRNMALLLANIFDATANALSMNPYECAVVSRECEIYIIDFVKRDRRGWLMDYGYSVTEQPTLFSTMSSLDEKLFEDDK